MPFAWTDVLGRPGRALAWRHADPELVVVAVHGLSGAAEQFAPVAHGLSDCSVYALELAGQGWDPDPARRGTRLDLDQQLRNLDLFLEAVRSEVGDRPVVLLGESMGALLTAAHAASRPESPVSAFVHAVPVVALRRSVPRLVRRAVRWLGTVAPGLRTPPSVFVNGRTTSPPLTRDKAYQTALHHRPHRIPAFTFRFLAELGDLMDSSLTMAQGIHRPSLTLAAGADCFVRVDQIQTWHDAIPCPNKSLHIYPDAYHLLWHDWDRERVLQDLRNWLGKLRNSCC